MHVWPRHGIGSWSRFAIALRRNRHRLSTAVVLDQRMGACYSRFKFKLPWIRLSAKRRSRRERRGVKPLGQPQKSRKDEKRVKMADVDGRRWWLGGISRRSIALPLEFGSRPIRSPPQLPIPALPSQLCRRLRFERRGSAQSNARQLVLWHIVSV